MEKNEVKAVNEEAVATRRCERPKKRLNPVIKWVLIGVTAGIVVGTGIYLIVKGKEVPVEAVEKAVDVAVAAA